MLLRSGRRGALRHLVQDPTHQTYAKHPHARRQLSTWCCRQTPAYREHRGRKPSPLPRAPCRNRTCVHDLRNRRTAIVLKGHGTYPSPLQESNPRPRCTKPLHCHCAKGAKAGLRRTADVGRAGLEPACHQLTFQRLIRARVYLPSTVASIGRTRANAYHE